MNRVLEECQELTPSNLVTFYEIDVSSLGGNIERYHPHNDGPITWQGNVYLPWPIAAANFETQGDGRQSRPSLTVGNIGVDSDGNPYTGVITALCLMFDDLVGSKVTRKRTFVKFLDAVNFENGNSEADPNAHFKDDVYIISQKQKEIPESVTFALSSPLQFENAKLPSRQIIASRCGWLLMAAPNGGYRGAYCGYTGENKFDKNGNPVSDPAQDKCGGLVSDCKKRFGEFNELRFGSFPSADRIK